MSEYLSNTLNLLKFLKIEPKRQILYEVFLVLVFTASELFGVFLLLPILSFIVQRSFSDTFLDVVDGFFIQRPSDAALFFVLLAVYVARFWLTKTTISLQLREVYRILGLLNKQLFREINSSGRSQKMEDVMQCGIIEANNICIGFYMQLIRLISESTFVLVTTVSLILLMPFVSIILFSIFSLGMITLQERNKRALRRYGQKRLVIDGERTGMFEFVSRGSLEMKTYGVVDDANKNFAGIANEYAFLGMKYQNVKMMQKYWIETIFVISAIVSMILSPALLNASFDALETAVLFGAVAVKTLPSFSRITNHLNTLQYYKSSIKKYSQFIEGV